MTELSLQNVPEHVPPHLVYDFDFFAAPAHSDKPHFDIANELLSKAPPIFFTPRNGGHWVVTRAEASVDMFRNHELFSSNPDFNSIKAVNPTRHFPLFYDPPEHTDARKLLMPYFKPAAIHALEPYLRQVAIELIETALLDGECDFVRQIAGVFPIAVFFKMADISMEHRETLIEMANRYLRSPDPDVRQSGLRNVIEFIKDIVDQRRKTSGNDLISGIVTGQFLGRALTEPEALSAATTILMAGLDTVTALMSFSLAFLARHPEHYRQLTESPELIPAALEELIRVHAVAMPERGCTRDVVINGVEFKKCDRLVFLLQIQGLTDDRVPNPFAVDFHRSVSPHIAFGSGPHRCIASHLARLELKIFLEEWVRRVGSFEIKNNEKLTIAGGGVWVPRAVPLTLHAYAPIE